MDDRHAISEPEKIKRFALAGNAILTLQNESNGKRATYRIRKAPGRLQHTCDTEIAPDGVPLACAACKEETPFFVSVLTGSDNDSDYTYLGTIWNDARGTRYFHGKKSSIGADSPSGRGATWLFRRLSEGGAIPEPFKVYHEGRCGACGRRLTVPESIESGLGPECAKRFAAAGAA